MRRTKNHPAEEWNIHWQDHFAYQKIGSALQPLLPAETRQPILFLCIGTDRSTGDALGPLVGTFLKKKILPENFSIMGTLKDPIHAMNLNERIQEIDSHYQSPYVVAIDACLGKNSSIGRIYIRRGPVKPGSGVHKQLPAVGHIHIAAVVNMAGFMEYFVLQNTRLHLVMSIAQTIADGIEWAGWMYRRNTNCPLKKLIRETQKQGLLGF
jgi:putative sporulation protein YyaC